MPHGGIVLVNGLKVIVSDPDPDIASKVAASVAAALPALAGLGFETTYVPAMLSFEKGQFPAVGSATIVQECGPERVEFKQELWKTIEAAAPKDALLCSSSSTIPRVGASCEMSDPARLLVGHPFNPPHLMPLVEVVPTPQTDPRITAQALAFYEAMGKVALAIKKEIPGFVANRLQAAIFQESVFLVAEGVVTLDELDDIVTNSLGIRWATSGPFLSFHLGGGPGGLAHFLEHLGPPMELAWKNLGKGKLDAATKTLLGKQLGSSYAASSFYALAETRDAKEVAVINALAEVGRAVPSRRL